MKENNYGRDYGRQGRTYWRQVAVKNGEKPLSAFHTEDVIKLKNFLIRCGFCTKDDLKNLTLIKVKAFMKMENPTSVQSSDYYRNTNYYSLPSILTNGKASFYRDIKYRHDIDKTKIQKLIDICKENRYKRAGKEGLENKHIAVVSYMENGKEKTSYAKVYATRCLLGDYDSENDKFVFNGHFKNIENATILDYIN